jgi:hypothetical protein
MGFTVAIFLDRLVLGLWFSAYAILVADWVR